jgi:hypothetical protein
MLLKLQLRTTHRNIVQMVLGAETLFSFEYFGAETLMADEELPSTTM